ncbi:MAG: hypothetical protein IJY57_04750 [Clostridia bacterium]|nr:hypothetical protein [Clostridia bacterium]
MKIKLLTKIKWLVILLSLMLFCVWGFVMGEVSLRKTRGASGNFYYANYENINTISNVSNYLGSLDNASVSDGVVISPYYTLKVNGESVPVYATRTANGVHSFVYIDVDPASEFSFDFEITGSSLSTVFTRNVKCEVLPLKHGVTATATRSTKKVTATINKLGSYSFVFNSTYNEPLTVLIAEKEDTTELFGSKQIEYINAGDYSTSSTYSTTRFTTQNKVYYFRAGRYKIDQIKVPSNSVVYFEKGAYLEVKPSPVDGANAFVYSYGTQNITIAGRPLFDMSGCQGAINYDGSVRDKGGFSMDNVSNITVQGVNIINSQTWTMCFTDCREVQISDLMFFGYRTYADGVMIANSVNAVCEDSFIRTGDDAFETKSTSPHGNQTNNVTFRNCDAWTDKAVAYGCIYESTYDQSNVTFENCTVGFALGNWSEHLGNCVIQLGQQDSPRTTHDIKFKNIEIYHNNNNAVLNCYIGGSGGSGDGAGTIKDIYFQNITCKTNNGNYMVNLQTYDSTDCFIKDIYIDNLVVGGTQLTSSNRSRYVNTSKVVGGYNTNLLHINTLPTEYSVSVTANNSTVSGITSGDYEEGSSVSVMVSANAGYYIDRITWNGAEISVTDKKQTQFSKTITADTELIVYTTAIPTFSVEVQTGGALVSGIATGSYEENTLFNIEITAPSGYDIKSVSWNGESVSVGDANRIFFTKALESNSLLVVVLEEEPPQEFVVAVNALNATVSGINSGLYIDGTACSVVVRANDGYLLSQILLNGQEVALTSQEETSFSLTVTENITLNVTAEEKPSASVTSYLSHATIDGVSAGKYDLGATFTISVVAEDGYEITSIKWGDQDVEITNNKSMQFEVTLLEDTAFVVSTAEIQAPTQGDTEGDTEGDNQPTTPSNPSGETEQTPPTENSGANTPQSGGEEKGFISKAMAFTKENPVFVIAIALVYFGTMVAIFVKRRP